MNPISIFPPPTRALSRQNTKSNNSGNNASSATSPLSRFHTSHHAAAADDHHGSASSPSSSTAAAAAAAAAAGAGSAGASSSAAGGSLIHGRNKSFGAGGGLVSASAIWSPFTSADNSSPHSSPGGGGGDSGSGSGKEGHHTSTSKGASATSPSSGSVLSGPRKLIKKRAASAQIITTAAGLASASSQHNNNNNNANPSSSVSSASSTSLSPVGGSAVSGSPAAYMAENLFRNHYPNNTLGPSPISASIAKRKPTPDIPASLPQTIFFDRLRPTEVTLAHRLEVQGYPEEDAASLEKLRYRQAAAPHLFMGAFLPGAPKAAPKAAKGDHSSKESHAGGNANGAGNTSGGASASSAQPPRTLIGFITATAAPALTLRSMSTHSNSKDARLVCIHSVVVAPEYQRKGLALRMLREYIGRLMRAEMGPREARLAALAEAKANADAAAATAAASGVPACPTSGDDGVSPKAPVAFEDDDLLGDEDDEAEVENERSGDRQSRKRGYEAMALLAHDEIVPLYQRAGFRIQGLSHINYGSGDWFEMRRDIVPRSAIRRDESDEDDDDDDDDDGAETSPQATSPFAARSVPSLLAPVLPSSASRPTSAPHSDSAVQSTGQLQRQHSTSRTNPGKSTGTDSGAAASGQHGQSPSDDSGGATASPPLLNLPASLNPAKLLAALTGAGSKAGASSSSASSDAGGKGKATTQPQASRNPGVPFSTVLGQALAGKTASEDPRSTLEARLVNREEDTNIADLYCPRDACNCLLLRADLGVWKARELGPLCAPALQSSSASLPANSPAPPLNGVVAPPPRPSAEQHSSPLIFATGGAAQQQQQQQQQPQTSKISMQGATSLRDFWSVPSPFVFDNISFSKDVQWPPRQPSANPGSPTSPGVGAGPRKAQPLGSKKKEYSMDPHAYPFNTSSAFTSGSWHLPGGGQSNAAAAAAESEGPRLTIKYLLCPECDCGPLGYVVISDEMKAGGLARAVAASQAGREEGGVDATTGASKRKMEYLLAADRVRYRFKAPM
ncbi:hypothetical protein OC835_001486 [Tilletia horrida]|nr:hypothetical protein OC835_001486 [Tilletia horrida]